MTGLITPGGILLCPASIFNSATLLCVIAASSWHKGKCVVGSQTWQEGALQGFCAKGYAGPFVAEPNQTWMHPN